MANTKVQSEQIEDGSITADKLADGTIVAAELADNAVVTAAINADAVTGAKIADNAIDSEHYTDGSIDTAHIADAQITVGKMAANSVDSDQYVDGSIDTVHIADAQVTTAKITDGNISTAKIADNAVTSAKIDTNIDIAGTFDVTGATTLDSTLAVAGISTLNVSAIIKSAGTDDTPADLSFWHTDASIASGDDIAVISAEGSDSGGSPPYQGAKITFDADANWDTGTSNYYPTNINFFTQDNSGTDTIAAGSRLTIQSDGKVGIGTASPAGKFHVAGHTASVASIFESSGNGDTVPVQLKVKANNGTTSTQGLYGNAGSASTDNTITLGTNGTTGLTVNNDGKVGIGTTSPSSSLHVSGNSSTRNTIVSNVTIDGGTAVGYPYAGYGFGIDFKGKDYGNTAIREYGRIIAHMTNQTSQTEAGDAGFKSALSFYTNTGGASSTAATEKMTITAEGNVLVGTTDVNPSNNGASGDAGHAIAASGYLASARSGDTVALFNRMDSDGDVVDVRKDGSSIGSLGVKSGDLVIHSSQSGHVGLSFGNTRLEPTNNAGSLSDGNVDLGNTDSRFKDLYLSGGAYVGGTAAANKLDDYEEGTFEPTATVAGGSGTVAFTSGGNLLSYTKIGNTVFITGTLQIDSNSANAGRLNIGNLPFTSANGTDFSTRALMDSRIEGGTGSQASGYFTVINEGASHLQIQTYTGITSSNDSAVTMAANSTITISGNYQAA